MFFIIDTTTGKVIAENLTAIEVSYYLCAHEIELDLSDLFIQARPPADMPVNSGTPTYGVPGDWWIA